MGYEQEYGSVSPRPTWSGLCAVGTKIPAPCVSCLRPTNRFILCQLDCCSLAYFHIFGCFNYIPPSFSFSVSFRMLVSFLSLACLDTSTLLCGHTFRIVSCRVFFGTDAFATWACACVFVRRYPNPIPLLFLSLSDSHTLAIIIIIIIIITPACVVFLFTCMGKCREESTSVSICSGGGYLCIPDGLGSPSPQSFASH